LSRIPSRAGPGPRAAAFAAAALAFSRSISAQSFWESRSGPRGGDASFVDADGDAGDAAGSPEDAGDGDAGGEDDDDFSFRFRCFFRRPAIATIETPRRRESDPGRPPPREPGAPTPRRGAAGLDAVAADDDDAVVRAPSAEARARVAPCIARDGGAARRGMTSAPDRNG
jgi:hypothetical protein